MKKLLHLLLAAGAGTLLLAGCGSPSTEADDHEHGAHPAAATFDAGRGVELTAAGREAIGFATTNVVPATIRPDHKRPAQIYRGADERAATNALGRTRPGFAYASLILPAAETRDLSKGQTVRLGDDATPRARLLGVDRQLEPVTGQAEVLVEIPDSERAWRVGDFVPVAFGNDAKAQGVDAVAVPKSAILTTAKGPFAFVQNGDAYLRTPVTIAGRNGDSVLITDGLYEGDVVASGGVEQLYLVELQAVNAGHSCSHGH